MCVCVCVCVGVCVLADAHDIRRRPEELCIVDVHNARRAGEVEGGGRGKDKFIGGGGEDVGPINRPGDRQLAHHLTSLPHPQRRGRTTGHVSLLE